MIEEYKFWLESDDGFESPAIAAYQVDILVAVDAANRKITEPDDLEWASAQVAAARETP